jgi:hypothetical protein
VCGAHAHTRTRRRRHNQRTRTTLTPGRVQRLTRESATVRLAHIRNRESIGFAVVGYLRAYVYVNRSTLSTVNLPHNRDTASHSVRL